MLDCPFCGNQISEANIGKSRTGWKEDVSKSGKIRRHYVDASEPGATPCWQLKCGGCEAELSADSREELLVAWNQPQRSEWADQEYIHDNTGVPNLERCPLCDLDVMSCTDDSFHPTAVSWQYGSDGKKQYSHISSPAYRDGTRCYTVNCPTSAGGCGLSVEADSKQEASHKWNTRVGRNSSNAFQSTPEGIKIC